MTDPLHYSEEDAFHGILGEYARQSAPHIEVDHFTLYGLLLVIFGNLIGRRRACYGGDSLNFANLFALVVAETAQGKGSVTSRAERFAESVDPSFRSRLHYDVQSAGALIRLIADEQPLAYRGRKKQGAARRGVVDKRCLLSQGEMQSIFTAKGRSGSTLGPVLKLAYDGVTLENNKVDESLRATDPHVSVIGSITPKELRQAISSSRIDLANGFYNRFLFFRPQVLRLLPHGGDRSVAAEFVDPLKTVLASLGPTEPPSAPLIMEFDDEAHREWEPFYYACRDPQHPFFDGLTGFRERLAPNVKRVAMILATLEGRVSIGVEHLRSARAFGLRCEDNASEITASDGALGQAASGKSSVADCVNKLLAKFDERSGWFDRKALWTALSNRGDKATLHAAIDELVDRQLWERSTLEGVDSFRVVPKQDLAVMTVSLSAEVEPGVCEHELREDERMYRGHRYRLGDPLLIARSIGVINMDDKEVSAAPDTEAYLIQPAENSSDEDRNWVIGLKKRKPNHRLIHLDGEPVWLSSKLANEWAIKYITANASKPRPERVLTVAALQ